MRNGNIRKTAGSFTVTTFLPYLWGMETINNPIMEYKITIVLTVPMRNGNGNNIARARARVFGSYRTYEEWKHATVSTFSAHAFCSYRTYEEWKQCSLARMQIFLHSSYRTYEEWKHGSVGGAMLPFLSSYRTYEEWKLPKSLLLFLGFAKFLPYLWGMETIVERWNAFVEVWRSYRTYEEWKHLWHRCNNINWEWVLTVPMRNGNLPWGTYFPKERSVLTVPMRNGNSVRGFRVKFYRWFLPYLWGMETIFEDFKAICEVSSYRTYEEWKHSFFAFLVIFITSFLPYLWGMETPKAATMVEKLTEFLPYLWGMETGTTYQVIVAP